VAFSLLIGDGLPGDTKKTRSGGAGAAARQSLRSLPKLLEKMGGPGTSMRAGALAEMVAAANAASVAAAAAAADAAAAAGPEDLSLVDPGDMQEFEDMCRFVYVFVVIRCCCCFARYVACVA